MSDETPKLRLKPRLGGEAPETTPSPTPQPTPSAETPAPATPDATAVPRLKPRVVVESASSTPAQESTPTPPLPTPPPSESPAPSDAVQLTAPASEAKSEPKPKFSLRPRDPVEIPVAAVPSPEPAASPAEATPPLIAAEAPVQPASAEAPAENPAPESLDAPPPFPPLPAAANFPPPPGLKAPPPAGAGGLPPPPHVAPDFPAPKAAPKPAARSRAKLLIGVGLLAVVVLGLAGYFALVHFSEPEPLPPVRQAVVRPKVEPPPAAAPTGPIGQAKDAIAKVETQRTAPANEVIDAASAPSSSASTSATTSPSTAPDAATTAPAASVETPRPQLPTEPPVPSAAFRAWVQALKISGVRGGSNPRVFIDRTAYSPGDLVNPQLGIMFQDYNSETRQLIFKDRNGAIVERRH